ncbi:MAG: HAMP domain-containing histidine kinase [Candidatus Cloacimonetes bacterium]|nr:HAMP domain-containing histidine kinase [Candidatus Cloacimonadota bacterium]
MDELLIIQRIAHDLKNQVLLMKMMVSQKDKMRADDDELKSIIANISQMSITLSQFSHIKTLYREDCNLIKIIEQTISQYINHPLFDHIEFNHDVSDSKIKIDKTLFQIGLRNLINNALQNIDENGYIIVQLSDSKNKFYLEISNPGDIQERDIPKIYEIGYSTREEGSGIGIPISKMIVERHNGTFDITCKNNEVKVSIILPKN